MSREIMQQCLNKFEHLWEIGIDAEYKVDLMPEICALREELTKLEQSEYDKLTVKFGERAKEYLEAAKKSWQPESHIVKWSIPVDPNNFGEPLAQPEQEPVAWMLPEYGDVLPASQADGTGIYNIPLYTAPPRKEWVGLTNEELVEIREAHQTHIFQLMFAVEAKIREKNNAV